MLSRRIFVFACAAAWAIVPCAIAEPSADLEELADRYWDAMMRQNPTWATSLGDHRFSDRLDDLSEPSLEKFKQHLQGLLGDLRRLPAHGLSQEDRLTRDLLERSIRDNLLRAACLGHLMPIDPLAGPHLSFPMILVSQPFDTKEDFDAYVARLRGFPKQVADMIDNMRRGIATEFVAPRILVDRVIPQVEQHIVTDVTKSEFYTPVQKLGSLPEADREQVTAAIDEAIRTHVVPAYLQLLAFLQDEYLPRSRTTVGYSALPNGDKIYMALAGLNATVPVVPDEVHELGLSEVSRIRGEMDKAKDDLHFKGDLDAFIAHMRDDPKQRFKYRKELLPTADEYLRHAKLRLPKLFGRLPKALCRVKEMESFRAKSAPAAYYNLPSEDGSRPGYYYVNTYAPQERLRFTMEALTYHEAVPGHHLQMALDQENQSFPKFRRYARFTAYEEGWALYAEKLGYDVGGYKEPDNRYGQLSFEMWRACRLVVDTGLHVKGWSRQQAIDFIVANTSLARHDIEAEVDRYVNWPGQALGYKIGELRILQLRKEAEETLKDRFYLPAFHDALLAGGAMPIDMLETRMRAWIASQ